MLDGMVCVGWNNVIFAPSSPLSSSLFGSGHLLSDQLNKTIIDFYLSSTALCLNSFHFDQEINNHQQECDIEETAEYFSRRHGCELV